METVTVTFVQRKKGEFWSLEVIFDTVRAHLPPGCEGILVSAPAQGAKLAAILRNLAWARSLRGDLFHVTGDIHYAVLGLGGAPIILTVHDLRFLEEARGWRRFLFWLFWVFLPGRLADRVTAISEQTKERLVRFGRLAPDKIRVIPNPIAAEFQALPKTWNSARPVLLHVGTTSNKNLERVVAACDGLDVTLWILGRIRGDQARMLAESGIDHQGFDGLPPAAVAALYGKCDVVVFPSLYEGFGMPILEGQAVGRPVLTSDRSPLREVAGGGALLVDPEKVDSIRAGLARLLQDADLRAELVRKGLENVKRYAPEAVAARYAELYREVLSV